MKGMKKYTIIRSLVLVLLMTVCFGQTVCAKESTACREVVADESMIKAYISGTSDAQDAKYQIGNVEADVQAIYAVDEDSFPMRTLIMLDNSLSIPSSIRGQISELLNGIIEDHGKDEMFRLATFAGETVYLSDDYSADYTALKNVIGSINYNNQETYLTDVLYGVLDDLEQEHYMGYTRIIIISDGVDNNPVGITRDELNAKLLNKRYPVYTIGIKTKSNNKQLKNMFALSRKTESSYWFLDQQDTQPILSDLAKDYELTVFQIRIPEKAKTGGKQSSKLTLGNEQELIFDVEMPFSIEQEPEQEEKEPQQEQVLETIENSGKEEQESQQEAVLATTEDMGDEEQEPKQMFPIWMIIVGLVAGVALVVGTVAILKMKKKDNSVDKEVVPLSNEEEGTIIINDALNNNQSGQFGVLPEFDKKTSYRVTFTDRKDPSKTFQCELRDKIRIGRGKENDIRIDYDKVVSGRHCMITNINGRFFLKDLGSSNKTYLNGNEVYGEVEIFTGNTIKLGRPELIVKFEQINHMNHQNY